MNRHQDTTSKGKTVPWNRCNSQVETLATELETTEEAFDMNPDDDDDGTADQSTETPRGWFSWRASISTIALKESEQAILAILQQKPKGVLVNIGPVIDENDSKIWTIILNEKMKNESTALLLVHGLGAGLALWAKNLEPLAKNRTVYAIDVLGFGRSSRSTFKTDAIEAELQFVSSIEEWRISMGLEKFILLGHSLGAFICTSYAIKYPSRVCHLILADPWGFQNPPADLKDISHIPFHHRVIVRIMEPLNPLWSIRLLGSTFAPRLIQKIRADLIHQFEHVLEDASLKISDYIYHCNVQNPTGESAFHSFSHKFGWAKNPMSLRLFQLDEKTAITLIYGAKSWVDHVPIDRVKALRPNSVVDGHVLAGAGHHVYADKSEEFNKIVTNICASLDDDTILFSGAASNNESKMTTTRDSNDNYTWSETIEH